MHIKRTINRWLWVSCFILNALTVFAAPPEFIIIPDTRKIVIGDEAEEVKIIAVAGKKATFRWTLEGPGQLAGNPTASKISYVPPVELSEAQEAATVTVTITSRKGKQTTHTFTFQLTMPPSTAELRVSVDVPDVKVFINGDLEGLAHPDRPLIREYVPAGKTVITVTAQSYPDQSKTLDLKSNQSYRIHFKLRPLPEHLRVLLRKGDAYLAKGNYISPEGNNAFDAYKTVLKSDPNNEKALDGITEIGKQLKRQGDQAYAANEFTRAETVYQQYLIIAEYLSNIRPFSNHKAAYESAVTHLKELKKLVLPIDQLIDQAEDYFHKKRYTLPKDGNAFDIYRLILKKKPTNLLARQRILEMMGIYREWGNSAYAKKAIKKAKAAYQQYLMVATYVNDQMADIEPATDIADIEDRIESLSGSIKTVESLIKKANIYFMAERFTTPANGNAFETYKAVLEIHPNNRQALRKIHTMMEKYLTWGNRAYQLKRFKNATSHYEHYLSMAEVILELNADSDIQAQAQRVKTIQEKMTTTDELLQKANVFYKQEQWVSPENENVFDICRKILTVAPDNSKAIDYIYQIAYHYKEKADKAYRNKSYETSKAAYQTYQRVAEYIDKQFGGAASTPDLSYIRSQIDRLDHLMRLEQIKSVGDRFLDHVDRYERLVQKENENSNVAYEIVQALKDIVKDLKEITRLYDAFPVKDLDMIAKIQKIRETQKKLEHEISVRMNKVI